MDRAGEQRMVLMVLRGVGILTVFIGLILATQTIFAVIAAHSATANVPRGMNISLSGPVAKMQGWAIAARLSVSAWGAALYALAGALAGAIVADGPGARGAAAGDP